MGARSKSRKRALDILYSADVRGDSINETLAAEAKRANSTLPVETVMCTVALARRLNLPTENVKLASLARFWGVAQARPHDAADDALVLAKVLRHALTYAHHHDIALPLCSPRSLRPPVFNSIHRAA